MSTAKARVKGAARRLARLVARRPRPAILMYHRIGPEPFDPWGLAVERDRFAEQLEWLASNRSVLPLSEFAALHGEHRLSSDAIALTFDDGYASVLDAVPMLERHALTATIFLPVELIERGGAFWWDELAELVLGWTGDTLRFGDALLPVPPAHERDRSWPPDTPPRTPRQKLFQSLWTKLHSIQPELLDSAMRQLRDQGDSEAIPANRPMSPQEARSVKSSTISFGSHGLTHASLPTLSAEAKVHEIGESMARCAALTGSAPAAFAYPFGDLDDASIRLTEEAGYNCACATGDRFVTERSNRFALPRLRVGNWDVAALRDMLGA
jgi:peptidoglycan/xylan/chitin deacetylase (PgdA/CDA1 family)